jgi:adenylate cyclase class 2
MRPALHGGKSADVIIRSMAKSSRENEIKLAFASADLARDALVRAGARESFPRTFEDNVLFDLPDRALTRTGCVLRLRRTGSDSTLTMKAPVPGTHRHKVRAERETRVDDHEEMAGVLTGIGLEPVYRYQKFRTAFALQGVTAVLDETPLGTFVELEGDPEELDRAATLLGAGPADYILESYRELHERDAAAKGIEVGDLLLLSP